jgi:hypothetical protein
MSLWWTATTRVCSQPPMCWAQAAALQSRERQSHCSSILPAPPSRQSLPAPQTMTSAACSASVTSSTLTRSAT